MDFRDTQDIFLTASLRSREVKGLSREVLNRLLRACTVAEGLECLKGTAYDDGQARTLQGMLDNRRSGLLDHVVRYAAHNGLIRLIALPYDNHNVKTGLKNILHNTGHWDLLVPWGTLSVQTVREIFETESYERLPGPLEEAVGLAVERYFALKKPAVTDCVLDRAMYAYALDLCRGLNSRLLGHHVKQRIDMANVRAFARRDLYPDLWDELFIPGGYFDHGLFAGPSSGVKDALNSVRDYEALAGLLDREDRDLLALERETEQVLSAGLAPCRFMIRGVEAVYAHVYAVELEIFNVGLVFAALSIGMDRDLSDRRRPALIGDSI